MRDVILHLPRWLSDVSSTSKQRDNINVIFFITGNPGLISYYETLLDLLSGDVAKDVIIAGASLGGFEQHGEITNSDSERRNSEADRKELESDLLFPPDFTRKPIYDLQDQIELTYKRLRRLIQNIRREYAVTNKQSFKVVIMGHSVGAYIAMEVVRLQHESIKTLAHTQTIPFTISATMLLTPTIHDISKSPSGKIATPVLSNIPFFPLLVQGGASSLAATLPTSWLRYVVARVTGMPEGTGLESTLAFLQTPGAVKQALVMARCEMLQIGKDRWTTEVWGIVAPNSGIETELGAGSEEKPGKAHSTDWTVPKHHFLFAKDDHWVAHTTREAITQHMQTHAAIVTDSDGSMGLVHAWCIKQNELVAEIISRWLHDVLNKL